MLETETSITRGSFEAWLNKLSTEYFSQIKDYDFLEGTTCLPFSCFSFRFVSFPFFFWSHAPCISCLVYWMRYVIPG